VTGGDTAVTPRTEDNYSKLLHCDTGDSGDTVFQGLDIENTKRAVHATREKKIVSPLSPPTLLL